MAAQCDALVCRPVVQALADAYTFGLVQSHTDAVVIASGLDMSHTCDTCGDFKRSRNTNRNVLKCEMENAMWVPMGCLDNTKFAILRIANADQATSSYILFLHIEIV